MSDSDARSLYQRICNLASDGEYFQFLQEVNQHLSDAHFEVRRIINPVDQQQYVGFINLEADKQSNKSVKYRGRDGKPDVRHTAFFRAVLDRIAVEEEHRLGGLGVIPSSVALNLPLALESSIQATQEVPSTQASQGRHLGELGKRDREVLLAQLVEDGWLAVPPGHAGRYTFGVRSLLELGEYIMVLDLPVSTRDILMKYL